MYYAKRLAPPNRSRFLAFITGSTWRPLVLFAMWGPPCAYSGSDTRSHALPVLTKLSPFYPSFAYELDTDGSDSADFRIVGVSNRGLSGVIYRIKVARVCSKQGRRNAWGARIGKIADAEFHARKIKRQPPISNDLVKRDGQKWQTCNNQNNSFRIYVYGSL